MPVGSLWALGSWNSVTLPAAAWTGEGVATRAKANTHMTRTNRREGRERTCIIVFSPLNETERIGGENYDCFLLCFHFLDTFSKVYFDTEQVPTTFSYRFPIVSL